MASNLAKLIIRIVLLCSHRSVGEGAFLVWNVSGGLFCHRSCGLGLHLEVASTLSVGDVPSYCSSW